MTPPGEPSTAAVCIVAALGTALLIALVYLCIGLAVLLMGT